MTKNEVREEIKEEIKTAEVPGEALPGMLGDFSEPTWCVLLIKVTEHDWVDVGLAETVEEALSEMMLDISEMNERLDEGELPYGPCDFVIANEGEAERLARMTESFVNLYDRYIPKNHGDVYVGMGALLEVLEAFPEVATADTPNVFSALEILRRDGLVAAIEM